METSNHSIAVSWWCELCDDSRLTIADLHNLVEYEILMPSCVSKLFELYGKSIY